MENLGRSPRIFVGSSREAEKIDRQVRKTIEKLGGEAIHWGEISKPGDNILDVLVNLASSIDGALLIATPDDPKICRSVDCMSPRDNIILESGIFISKLGKHRTGIIHVESPKQSSASLPSDLQGLTTIKYFPDKPGTNECRLEAWLEEVRCYINDRNPDVDQLIEMFGKKFCSLPIFWRNIIQKYSVKPFKQDLNLAMSGEICLSPGDYYSALYSEIDNVTSHIEIRAVATLPSLIWNDDPEQRTYLEKNLKAAERGADIRRLFILQDNQWEQMRAVLKEQIDKGIQIRRASISLLGQFPGLEDMVIFKDIQSGDSCAYLAKLELNPVSIQEKIHIKEGHLIFNEDRLNKSEDTFDKIWAISTEINSKNIPKTTVIKKSLKQPSVNLKEYKLAKPVITCKEAAQAKGILLENELKTLILQTSNGYMAVELPGDAEASLRKIKDAIEAKNAHMASIEELAQLGLEQGTVSAVRDPVWNMPHLVSRRLLKLNEVSTNSGNKKGYYRFNPLLLLEAEDVMIGDFEKDYSNEIE
jgi:prolyl-tRNA editing enzyme YbaK/EbsC (Cys-tRNA(Pro) deacylase)